MATAKRKVIISCAVTGAVHTPSMSPYLPITPDQIVKESVEAVEAGAAIIHLHARNPNDGSPTPDPDVYMQFLPRIKQQTDGIINITTGGSINMDLSQRLAAAHRAQPEMTSLNMGSMNFGFFHAGRRITEWKYGWEEPYILSSKDMIFRNTFGDIECILKDLGEGYGTRFEFECYDLGHLYTLAYFLDRGLVKTPLFIQTIFGILGGVGADVENLAVMRETANRLFGKEYQWSVLAAGRAQMNFCTQAAIMGGNVRVGLEDSLFLGGGELAPSNASQVTKIRRILEELSLDVATPAEARAMLHLKGADAVNF